MPRQKLKPRPKVSSFGNRGPALRKPPNRPNCAAAAAAVPRISTRTRTARTRRTLVDRINWKSTAPIQVRPRSSGRDIGAAASQTGSTHHEGPRSARRARQRTEVLFHVLARRLGHFVGARQHHGVPIAVHLAPQRELEPLQPFGNRGLEPRQLGDVLVDAVVLELLQVTDDLIELARVDALDVAQRAAQLPGLSQGLARLVTQLPGVLGRQARAVPPAAPSAAIPDAA